jgi:hypothetical protein
VIHAESGDRRNARGGDGRPATGSAACAVGSIGGGRAAPARGARRGTEGHTGVRLRGHLLADGLALRLDPGTDREDLAVLADYEAR